MFLTVGAVITEELLTSEEWQTALGLLLSGMEIPISTRRKGGPCHWKPPDAHLVRTWVSDRIFYVEKHSFTGSRGAILENKAGFDEKFTPGKGFLWRWRIKVPLLTKEEETRLIKPLGGSGSSAGVRHTLEQELDLSLPTAMACSLESRQAFPRAMSFTPT